MYRAQRVFLPPPVGGLNTRDDPRALAATEASVLDNFYPEERNIVSRHNAVAKQLVTKVDDFEFTSIHSFLDGNGMEWVVFTFCLIDEDPLEFGVGAHIVGLGAVDLADGLTNGNFFSINFNGNLLLFNGHDAPMRVLTSALQITLQAATYTGPTYPYALIQGTTYRNRLYLVTQAQSEGADDDVIGSLYYGGVDEIQGALTEFDVAPLLKNGGMPYAVGTWTFDDSGGFDDRLVVYGSNGDLMIFEGSFPAGDDWRKVAHFIISPPVCRNCFAKNGGDLLILTQYGVLSVAALAATAKDSTSVSYLSDKITPTITDYLLTTNKRLIGPEAGDPDYTQLFVHKDVLIVNCQIDDGGEYDTEQLVMNLKTGAWCRYRDLNTCNFISYGGQIFAAGVSVGELLANVLYELSQDRVSIPILGYEIAEVFSVMKQGGSRFETPAQKQVSSIEPIISIDYAADDESTGFSFVLETPEDRRALDSALASQRQSLIHASTAEGVAYVNKTLPVSWEGDVLSLCLSYGGGDGWTNQVKYGGSWVTFTSGGLT